MNVPVDLTKGLHFGPSQEDEFRVCLVYSSINHIEGAGYWHMCAVLV